MAQGLPHEFYISIHSVARPRPRKRWKIVKPLIISIHSVARPRPGKRTDKIQNISNFNPLGRKTETQKVDELNGKLEISIHSVARPRRQTSQERRMKMYISIHSVARPRLHFVGEVPLQMHFNPLGRKTET